VISLGKPYKSELEKLEETYQWALEVPLDPVVDFVKSTIDLPMITVGSGGSYTSASYAALLHQAMSGLAYPATPLEILSRNRRLSKVALAFFSAGGRNRDILYSFEAAAHLEPEQLLVLCQSKGSKLASLAKQYCYVTLAEYTPPAGRDGFLATNSLLASSIIMTRAYGTIQPFWEKLPITLQGIIGSSFQEFTLELQAQVKRLLKKESVIILYGKWSKPVAIDVESKTTEAGLVNTQIADFRNFAHGRHNWLAKHMSSTGILALTTPEDEQIADKTLRIIPDSIPKVTLSTKRSNSVGTLELLIKTMCMIYDFGRSRNIDPGRPGVPSFGSRLYNLRTPFSQSIREIVDGKMSLKKRALFRKFGENLPINEFNQKAVAALDSFLNRLQRTKFNGVVFDYDGTLCDPVHRFSGPSESIGRGIERLVTSGIKVGIATGRGSSVRKDLRKLLPNSVWSEVLIGYYNGSDIATLQDDTHPHKDGTTDSTLSKFLSILDKEGYANDVQLTVRPKQITIENPRDSGRRINILTYQHISQRYGIDAIKILESSHSIDVVAPDVSKRNLVKTMEDYISKDGLEPRILKIGDKGRWPGNDFELLADEFSLSVDVVSQDFDGCWNIVPLGHRGEQATLDYLNMIKIQQSQFELEIQESESAYNAR
jgi:hydroxymethylpyrimidine pyrophosphatase-like HAD family hydrolase/fructoselysine-6-P-deglycase FrlB-like protein